MANCSSESVRNTKEPLRVRYSLKKKEAMVVYIWSCKVKTFTFLKLLSLNPVLNALLWGPLIIASPVPSPHASYGYSRKTAEFNKNYRAINIMTIGHSKWGGMVWRKWSAMIIFKSLRFPLPPFHRPYQVAWISRSWDDVNPQCEVPLLKKACSTWLRTPERKVKAREFFGQGELRSAGKTLSRRAERTPV